jgi:hypothetical protein
MGHIDAEQFWAIASSLKNNGLPRYSPNAGGDHALAKLKEGGISGKLSDCREFLITIQGRRSRITSTHLPGKDSNQFLPGAVRPGTLF